LLLLPKLQPLNFHNYSAWALAQVNSGESGFASVKLNHLKGFNFMFYQDFSIPVPSFILIQVYNENEENEKVQN
jgi:hypothetical protein